MLAGKRTSSAMDGKFKLIPEAWIPAIPAGMTILEKRIMQSDEVELSYQNQSIWAINFGSASLLRGNTDLISVSLNFARKPIHNL